MERTQRILDRFPEFYLTWDKTSIIYELVTAIGKRIDESEKDLDSILEAHWVDTAANDNLDSLARIYNLGRSPGESDPELRSRLKRAIIEYKGGGTMKAILDSVRMALRLPLDYSIEMVENPEAMVHREFTVQSGDTWGFSSESIYDAEPVIEIALAPEEEDVITDPTLTNLETGETITFSGEVKKGQTLIIEDGKAKVNKKEVKKSLSTPKPPTIPRRMTRWTYRQPISEEIGVFDTAVFDESKFAVGIPKVKLALRWMSNQLATFELRIPRSALTRKNSLQMARDAVESIKATGVKAIITTVED